MVVGDESTSEEEEEDDSLVEEEQQVPSLGEPARTGAEVVAEQQKPVSLRVTLFALCVLFTLNMWGLKEEMPPRRRFKRICRNWIYVLVICAGLYVQIYCTILSTTLSGDLTNYMVAKDSKGFYDTAWKSGTVACVCTLCEAVIQYARSSWGFEIRRFMTTTHLSYYIANPDTGEDHQIYYRLKFQGRTIDNIDQRIVQDFGIISENAPYLFRSVLQAVGTGYSSFGALYAIQPDLFWSVLGFSLGVAFLQVVCCLHPMMLRTRVVLALEATLRYALIRVRENAEAVAFFRGAFSENKVCNNMLTELIAASYRKMHVMVFFYSSGTFVDMFGALLPTLVVSKAVLTGQLSLGTVSTSGGLAAQVIGSVRLIMAQLETVSTIGASLTRIMILALAYRHVIGYERFEQAAGWAAGCMGQSIGKQFDEFEGEDDPSKDKHRNAVQPLIDDVQVLRLTNLTICTPTGSLPLLSDMSLTLRKGMSMLISGESGCGKSSLLRAIGGLWANTTGSIERADLKKCFFLPQQPYVTLGTLRQNAIYPKVLGEDEEELPTDAEIEKAMADANMSYLLDRHGLDRIVNFNDMLSGGERQRLSFARLLLQRHIDFVLLDESTSALDEENEQNMYSLIKQNMPCFLSVGHRAGLVNYHTHRLVLTRKDLGGATWRVEEIAQ